jgi:hypothetical protein
MDSNNTDTIERENPLDALLTLARGSGEASVDMALGGQAWHERDADSARFQRYEASRKQGAKRNARRCVIDGVIRYADKPYSSQRPRPPSPELLAFYRELAAAKKSKELF